jgi:hypothetical protein
MALKVNMATNNARVGFTILLIAVLFTVGYHSFPEYHEGIKFLASLLGWSAALFGAYCAVVSLNLKIKQDKRVESFRILEKLNLPEFVVVRNLIAQKAKKRHEISDKDFYALVNKNKEFYNGVTMFWVFWKTLRSRFKRIMWMKLSSISRWPTLFQEIGAICAAILSNTGRSRAIKPSGSNSKNCIIPGN